MGFRLYIRCPFINNERKEICFGKLYGYLDGSFHSYSLDYLLSINFFDDYDLEEYDEDPYNAAVLIFDSMLSGEFEIEYKYFLRFISQIELSDSRNFQYPIISTIIEIWQTSTDYQITKL